MRRIKKLYEEVGKAKFSNKKIARSARRLTCSKNNKQRYQEDKRTRTCARKGFLNI